MFDLTSTGANGRLPVPAEPPRGRIDAPIGEVESGPDWRRALKALRRHVWLILVVTALAGVAGWYASRIIRPLYETHATIWIDEGTRRNERSPLAPSDLFDAQGWVELLSSDAVLDTVVARLHLFVTPTPGASDTGLFARPPRPRTCGRAATCSPRTRPPRTSCCAMPRTMCSKPCPLGTRWGTPSVWSGSHRRAWPGAQARYPFSLHAPHAVAQQLGAALDVSINQQASYLQVAMSGTDATQTATVLNEIAERYVQLASSLQHERLTQLTRVLHSRWARRHSH